MTWWKFLYDAETPTARAFGRVAFVQADTEAEAQARGLDAAKAEYPTSEVIEFAIERSTAAAAAAFVERRARWAQWMENTRTGVPNARGSL